MSKKENNKPDAFYGLSSIVFPAVHFLSWIIKALPVAAAVYFICYFHKIALHKIAQQEVDLFALYTIPLCILGIIVALGFYLGAIIRSLPENWKKTPPYSFTRITIYHKKNSKNQEDPKDKGTLSATVETNIIDNTIDNTTEEGKARNDS